LATGPAPRELAANAATCCTATRISLQAGCTGASPAGAADCCRAPAAPDAACRTVMRAATAGRP